MALQKSEFESHPNLIVSGFVFFMLLKWLLTMYSTSLTTEMMTLYLYYTAVQITVEISMYSKLKFTLILIKNYYNYLIFLFYFYG